MKRRKSIVSFILALFLVIGAISSGGAVYAGELPASEYLDDQVYVDAILGTWQGTVLAHNLEEDPLIEHNISMHVTSLERVIDNGYRHPGEKSYEFIGWAEYDTPSDANSFGKFQFVLSYYPGANQAYLAKSDWIGTYPNGENQKFFHFGGDESSEINLGSGFMDIVMGMKSWPQKGSWGRGRLTIRKVADELNYLSPEQVDRKTVTRAIAENDIIGVWKGEFAGRQNQYSNFVRCSVSVDVQKERSRESDQNRGEHITYEGVATYYWQGAPEQKGKFPFYLHYYPQTAEISLSPADGHWEKASAELIDKGVIFDSFSGYMDSSLTKITGLNGMGSWEALRIYYNVINLYKEGTAAQPDVNPAPTPTEPAPTVVAYDWSGDWYSADMQYMYEIDQEADVVSSDFDTGVLSGIAVGETVDGFYEGATIGSGEFRMIMIEEGAAFEIYFTDYEQDPTGETLYYDDTYYRADALAGSETHSRAKNDTNGRAKNDVSSTTDDFPELTFSDLPRDHWAYDYVKMMSGLGIIAGYPDNTFRPDDTFSRAAFAKLMSLSYGLDAYTGNAIVYRDVLPGDWYYPYVMAAERVEAINYYNEPDGSRTYRPNIPSEREDVAVALVTLLDLNPQDADLSLIAGYNDLNKISRDMRKYVALAYEYDIMKGDANGNFMPHEPLTRAQACTVFARVLMALNDN